MPVRLERACGCDAVGSARGIRTRQPIGWRRVGRAAASPANSAVFFRAWATSTPTRRCTPSMARASAKVCPPNAPPPPPTDPCGVPRRVGGGAEEEAGAAARGHAVGDRGDGRHRSPVDLRRSLPHATSSRASGGGRGQWACDRGGLDGGGGGLEQGSSGQERPGQTRVTTHRRRRPRTQFLAQEMRRGRGGGFAIFRDFSQFFAVLSAVFCLKRHRNIVGHLCRSVAPRDFGRFGHGTAFFSLSSRIFSHIFAIGLRSARNCPAIFANFRNFSRLDWTLPDRNPPPPSSPGRPTPGVVKEDKSSGGSVDAVGGGWRFGR